MVFYETHYREVHKGLEVCKESCRIRVIAGISEFSSLSEILSRAPLTCCSQLDPQNLMKACNTLSTVPSSITLKMYRITPMPFFNSNVF